ncbi:NAD-dependent epimerase/dehydratase family protein [Paenibacillus thiaminolyticus]|uniref:NAD(P)-dependent oxidoreductase n=1 Tax=Paenibacillus thiaminolyticus TaxID=49283 RepID=A0A3A3GJ54_PANTH|nr:NAD-dependent epimerase/dehydratase family protein [Paenibacillus thiaminolyticus]RJG24768.1 NAD(P)-dependent oxidoreductase [Paenibacillus thiaminolyticus]
MKSCLIGYTGFVGSTLMRKTQFDDLYNSKNIQEIESMEYDLIVCAGAPAVKWRANQAPDEDLDNIKKLMKHIGSVKTKRFVLISTVDVYQYPCDVDETTSINPSVTDPYGRHRYYLEQFVNEKFENVLVVRLPGLFGKGLKKNFIYDLIHNNCLYLTHGESYFQFYNMEHIWSNIQTALNNNLNLVNFAVEPVMASEISNFCLGEEFNNVTDKEPVHYRMKSIYANLFCGQSCEYIANKQDILNDIRDFIREEKLKLV